MHFGACPKKNRRHATATLDEGLKFIIVCHTLSTRLSMDVVSNRVVARSNIYSLDGYLLGIISDYLESREVMRVSEVVSSFAGHVRQFVCSNDVDMSMIKFIPRMVCLLRLDLTYAEEKMKNMSWLLVIPPSVRILVANNLTCYNMVLCSPNCFIKTKNIGLALHYLRNKFNRGVKLPDVARNFVAQYNTPAMRSLLDDKNHHLSMNMVPCIIINEADMEGFEMATCEIRMQYIDAWNAGKLRAAIKAIESCFVIVRMNVDMSRFTRNKVELDPIVAPRLRGNGLPYSLILVRPEVPMIAPAYVGYNLSSFELAWDIYGSVNFKLSWLLNLPACLERLVFRKMGKLPLVFEDDLFDANLDDESFYHRMDESVLTRCETLNVHLSVDAAALRGWMPSSLKHLSCPIDWLRGDIVPQRSNRITRLCLFKLDTTQDSHQILTPFPCLTHFKLSIMRGNVFPYMHKDKLCRYRWIDAADWIFDANSNEDRAVAWSLQMHENRFAQVSLVNAPLIGTTSTSVDVDVLSNIRSIRVTREMYGDASKVSYRIGYQYY